MNPLEMHGVAVDDQLRSWSELAVRPFDEHDTDPYTRARVMVMNGIETESVAFSHACARRTDDVDLRRSLAMLRRIDQQQQTVVAALDPGDRTPLETTIGHEQAVVDLTAWMARHEPDPHLRQAFDFALLEDFDHLYRFADLYDLLHGPDVARLTGHLTEITPGRPTFQQHRHPFDDVKGHFGTHTVDPLSRLHVMTILSIEQQAMNLYMTLGSAGRDPIARSLYAEIAMVEEQHVTHYESLLDPLDSWLSQLVVHEFNEAYLYWSMSLGETDHRLRHIWEHHLEMEIGQLQEACRLLRRYEGVEPEEILPAEFPATPVTFEPNKHYVRQVMAAQHDLRTDGVEYVRLADLPDDHRYFAHQRTINRGQIPSESVVEADRWTRTRDFRDETEGDHPIEELRPISAGRGR